MMRLYSAARFIAIVHVTLVSIGAPSYAQRESASIQIEIESGGFILGASGGCGTLIYMGSDIRSALAASASESRFPLHPMPR